MALIIAFRNVSALAPVSDYDVAVYINERLIDGPHRVTGHRRRDGYKTLLRKFLKQHPDSANAVQEP